MASDQRYCLDCGERRTPMSSVLLGGPPRRGEVEPPADTRGGERVGSPLADGGWQGGSTPVVIAGVGVLLLAMGVGVLIGRSGTSTPAAAPPQVISVASTPSPGAGVTPSSEASFTGDWPSGTSGFTVQLQTLPQSGTTVGAVQAAKGSARTRGAKGVGALKSDGFSSLTAGHYVIYSGVYHRRAEAARALSGLKRSFPGASVIEVSNRSAGSSSAGAASTPGLGGRGSSLSKPAPPTVLQNLSKKKGKNYEQESKNLPNVISTG
jgi:hypothetical protein